MSDPRPSNGCFPGSRSPDATRAASGTPSARIPAQVRISVALAFPDVYEIGMSYLGQKILYDLLNARPEWPAERVFAPWPDLEEALRARDSRCFLSRAGRRLSDFDVVGFSLLYELNYSNVLTMLDLGGIALRAADRPDAAPLVIAGGPAVFNPEPVAAFFDAFVAGDGEEAFPEILDFGGPEAAGAGRAGRDSPGPCRVWRASMSRPSMRSARRRIAASCRRFVGARRIEGTRRFPVEKRVSWRLRPVAVSGRHRRSERPIGLRPGRRRGRPGMSAEMPVLPGDDALRALPGQGSRGRRGTALRSVARTGYEDASLFALSVSDYPYLPETVRTLMAGLERRAGFALALRPAAEGPFGRNRPGNHEGPEDGIHPRPRGRDGPPAPGHQQGSHGRGDLLDAAANAFREGWRLLKIYVMIGLPTETEEDVEAIAVLWRAADGSRPGDRRRRPADQLERLFVHPQAAHAVSMGGHGRPGTLRRKSSGF